jgi:hypothetical protein
MVLQMVSSDIISCVSLSVQEEDHGANRFVKKIRACSLVFFWSNSYAIGVSRHRSLSNHFLQVIFYQHRSNLSLRNKYSQRCCSCAGCGHARAYDYNKCQNVPARQTHGFACERPSGRSSSRPGYPRPEPSGYMPTVCWPVSSKIRAFSVINRILPVQVVGAWKGDRTAEPFSVIFSSILLVNDASDHTSITLISPSI